MAVGIGLAALPEMIPGKELSLELGTPLVPPSRHKVGSITGIARSRRMRRFSGITTSIFVPANNMRMMGLVSPLKESKRDRYQLAH